MPDKSQIADAVNAVLPEILALRRELHRHPELSGREANTAATVAARLSAAGLAVRTGIGGHGVTALVGHGEPCLLLRADMDALPIQEQTGLDCASEVPGVMHACGHDFHTAWLTGTGLVLQRLGLPRGSVKLVFQPAEEALSGAADMLAADILSDPPVAAVCGAHVAPDRLVGEIALRPGSNLAAADAFTLRILGAGTHGANPHMGRDPIPVAAEIVLALQTLISRRFDPLASAVVSVCQIHGGSAFNIIPPAVELQGTVRTMLPEHRDMLEQAIKQVATNICHAHNCQLEMEYRRGVPPTVTDAGMTDLAREALEAVLETGNVCHHEQPSMGAEDFALYLQQRPGALLWVGCAPDEEQKRTMSLHHPHFCADEGCLRTTMLGLVSIALTYLERKQ